VAASISHVPLSTKAPPTLPPDAGTPPRLVSLLFHPSFNSSVPIASHCRADMRWIQHVHSGPIAVVHPLLVSELHFAKNLDSTDAAEVARCVVPLQKSVTHSTANTMVRDTWIVYWATVVA